MNETAARRNFWLGIFTLTVLGVVAYFVLFFVGKSQPFEEEFKIHVRFKNTQGLKNGSPVFLQGLPMGNVENMGVESDPQSRQPVLVAHLKLRNDRNALERITQGSSFTIAMENVFGDRRIDISFGDPTQPRLKNGDSVNGVEASDINSVFKQINDFAAKLNREFSLLQLAAEFQKLTAKQDKDIAEVKDAMKKLADLQTQMQSKPMSPEEARVVHELGQAATQLKEASDRLAQTAARSSDSEEELKALLRGLTEVLTRLQRTLAEPPK